MDTLPVAVITWCGDDPPVWLDLTSDIFEMRYETDQRFEGNVIEVDLADPGPEWTIEVTLGNGKQWTVEDGRGYVPTPMSISVHTLSVGSVSAEGATEADLGSVSFTMKRLVRGSGVYESTADEYPDYEVTPREEFVLQC